MKTVVEYSPDDHEYFAILCKMILRSPSAAIKSTINASVISLELIQLRA